MVVPGGGGVSFERGVPVLALSLSGNFPVCSDDTPCISHMVSVGRRFDTPVPSHMEAPRTRTHLRTLPRVPSPMEGVRVQGYCARKKTRPFREPRMGLGLGLL